MNDVPRVYDAVDNFENQEWLSERAGYHIILWGLLTGALVGVYNGLRHGRSLRQQGNAVLDYTPKSSTSGHRRSGASWLRLLVLLFFLFCIIHAMLTGSFL